MTDILERLQPGSLPIFAKTHAQLLSFSSRREEITAREVAAEILADPFATLYTLYSINKRISQRSDAEVCTVEHALMMQGIGAYLDAAKRLPIIENSSAGRDPKVLAALQELTRCAQHAAWQARDFAVLHSDIRAEEVQAAALLHFAPELLLWLHMPKQAIQLRRLSRRTSVVEAEISILGDSLFNLRLPLLKNWSIPSLTLDLLSPVNANRSRQTILAASLDIAVISQRGWWHERLNDAYIALAGVENNALETIIATAHANAARAARCCNWLEAPPAATWGPMIPGPWPPDEYDAADEEDAKDAKVATTAAAAAGQVGHRATQTRVQPEPVLLSTAKPTVPKPEPEPSVCPIPDKHIFREALKGIEGHLDGSYTLVQMSTVILQGLHTGLGLSRIILAMVTPDGARVRARFTHGISTEDPLRQFGFDLAGKDLFCQLMSKMQGVWLNQGNREKLWPMIHPNLQTMVSESGFYTMSLYNGNKPIGLLYADRGKGEAGHECSLDPLSYTDFKMLCLQASRGLGKIKASV